MKEQSIWSKLGTGDRIVFLVAVTCPLWMLAIMHFVMVHN